MNPTRACEKCGLEVSAQANFCVNCGHVVNPSRVEEFLSGATAITEYFLRALTTYIFKQDAAAGVAAVTAAKVMDTKQRLSLLPAVVQMADKLQSFIGEQDSNLGDQAHSQIMTVHSQISEKDWALDDVRQAKRILWVWIKNTVCVLIRPTRSSSRADTPI